MEEPKQNLPDLKILVVGDWVIDENWILIEHDSDTSTHVGRIHYRSLIDQVDAQILNLCGAGHVARSLYGLAENLRVQKSVSLPSLKLYCLGLWHPNDTHLLESLFTNEKITGQTPLTIAGPQHSESRKNSKKQDVMHYLKTMAQEDWSPSCGTARVTRQYKISAIGDPITIQRIDWQTKLAPNYDQSPITHLKKYLWDDSIDAIVVYDLHKGCVCENLIHALRDQYPDSDWYIRTKKMNVDWVQIIPEQRLKLRLIGADYVPSRSKTKNWFYQSQPSREAIEELRSWGLFDRIKSPHTDRWVVALHSNDNKIIALHKKAGGYIDGYITTDSSPSQSVKVGRSSIVFASCVASLLGCYGENQPETMLNRAYDHAKNWTKSYTDMIRSIKSENQPDLFAGAILNNYLDGAFKRSPVTQFDFNKEIESWRESFTNLGIVDEIEAKKKNKVFHLWRGNSCVPGYMAIRENLRENINELYQAIQNFKSKRKTTSLNCLILGAPGWGKTFLAERLGEVFDLNPLFFNLAQLTSLEQVIDCFDSISSLQNQQKRRPVLAFFDEIDSKVDGQYAFSMFLSPILDGTYRRGGHIFYLAPSIWLFAGVTDPTKIINAHKTADFMSRINGPTIRLDFGERKNHDPKSMTEQVYLGVVLLQDNFSDVHWVSNEVLELFHNLEMKHGVRSLEQAIRKFRNVQYGQVGRSNLPDYQEISSLIGINKNDYIQIKDNNIEEDFIEIRKTPL